MHRDFWLPDVLLDDWQTTQCLEGSRYDDHPYQSELSAEPYHDIVAPKGI